jgi:hypothetical protein
MRLVKRLYGFGEEALARLVQELLSNPRVAEAFTAALQKGFAAKTQMDRNMQTVLGLLNVPSRHDFNRLLTKLEAIQGSLVNLNLKVDRLLAANAARKRRKRPPSTDAAAPRETE